MSESDESHIYRPAAWNFGDRPRDGMGGPPVTDPLMLYAVVDDEVVAKTSLEEIIDSDIKGLTNAYGEIEERDGFISLRDGLRRLADKIDSAIAAEEIERLRRELAEARGLLQEARDIIERNCLVITYISDGMNTRPTIAYSAVLRIDAFLDKAKNESACNTDLPMP